MPEAELRRLVTEACGGSQGAFSELVKLFHMRLYHVVFRMVNNRDDAMELVQQVWVKAWTRRDSFRGESAYFTWLYKIAHFTCLDFFRKRQRRPEEEFLPELSPRLDPSVHIAGSSNPRPDRDLEHAEVRNAFDRALAALSPEHRTALVLREVEGLSYDEIARIMKCRKGTVMSRIFYARKNIQEAMKGTR